MKDITTSRAGILVLLLVVFTTWIIINKPVNSASMSNETNIKMQSEFDKPSKEKLKKRLSEIQYSVTQEDATERPFENAYWDNKKPGIYVDIVSGEPLFSSTDKFKSGTGWPSFTKPIDGIKINEKTDYVLFYARTELRSIQADSHLGHVFNDGPAPTGKRYCINSASLKFIGKDKLANNGYSKFEYLFKKGM